MSLQTSPVADAPFHVTVELVRKFDPLIVKLKPFAPATALFGDIDWTAGTGFPVGGGAELPPPQEHRIKAIETHTAAVKRLLMEFIASS